MRAVARKFKITQYKTTAYHPQSNGSIERSHHVLWEYLKQFVDINHEWDEHLRLAMFSYNTSVHEGTRFTPHELIFGKMARVPSGDPPLEREINETYTDYLASLFNRLRDTQELAHKNLIRAKERSKRYYDKRAKPQSFQQGEQVYLLKEPIKGKLSDQYTGPHVILEILPNHNVRIAVGSNKTRVVHENKLKGIRRIGARAAHPCSEQPHHETSEFE